jgi:hypothetical protein
MKFSHGKQVGCIVFGGGINCRREINRWRELGYFVEISDGYAAIYEAK